MPRAPRIGFARAIYHVMSRGNHLEPIVRDETDRQIWLKTLGEVCGDADPGRHVGMHLLDWPTDEYGSSSAEAVATT